MITVNSLSFDGTIRKSWKCELLDRRGSLLIALGEFDADVEHPDLGLIKKGTLSYELFWLDRWYNIFRFHEPSGELRNFYSNICMPPKFDGRMIEYVDLDVDVLISPEFDVSILDLDDFEASAVQYGYDADLRAKVEAALNEVLELFENRDIPELFATSGNLLRESGIK